MGHSLSIAAGIATAQPHRHVICLDGDGAAIMHLGSLAVTAHLPVPNLMHIVLNNGAHESVGGQPSVGHAANLTAVAKSFGYLTLLNHLETSEDLSCAVSMMISQMGPSFLDVYIKKGMRLDIPPLIINALSEKNFLINSIKNK
jgi:phosphonopyruvate decarboxylase